MSRTEHTYYNGNEAERAATRRNVIRTRAIKSVFTEEEERAPDLSRLPSLRFVPAQSAQKVATVANVDGEQGEKGEVKETAAERLRREKLSNYHENGMFHVIDGDPFSLLLESLYTPLPNGSMERYRLNLDPVTGKVTCNCWAAKTGKNCVHIPVFKEAYVPGMMRFYVSLCGPRADDAPDSEDELNHRISLLNPEEDF